MRVDCFTMMPVTAQTILGAAKVKPQSGGLSQNGQPVELGQPQFVIG